MLISFPSRCQNSVQKERKKWDCCIYVQTHAEWRPVVRPVPCCAIHLSIHVPLYASLSCELKCLARIPSDLPSVGVKRATLYPSTPPPLPTHPSPLPLSPPPTLIYKRELSAGREWNVNQLQQRKWWQRGQTATVRSFRRPARASLLPFYHIIPRCFSPVSVSLKRWEFDEERNPPHQPEMIQITDVLQLELCAGDSTVVGQGAETSRGEGGGGRVQSHSAEYPSGSEKLKDTIWQRKKQKNKLKIISERPHNHIYTPGDACFEWCWLRHSQLEVETEFVAAKGWLLAEPEWD